MKSLQVFVIVLLIAGLGAHCEAKRLGLLAGINVAKSNAASTSNTDFTGGIEFESLDYIPSFSVLFDVLYVARGANYLQLPLLGKLSLPLGLMNVFFVAGPDLAIKVSGGSGLLKGTDFSLDFGGGLEFTMLPAVNFFATARYAYGLVDISQANIGLKSRTWLFLAGLSFRM